jgi:hypothetical protein
MKIILIALLLCPGFLLGQPASSQYLIEEVFKFEIVKEQDYYRIDSAFLFELMARAYPDNWYIPVKRNLDLYGPKVIKDYKLYLDDVYQKNNLVIGEGHFFDNLGNKISFKAIFVLDKNESNWQFLHFCVSKDEQKPGWEFFSADQLRCVNGNHSIISAGESRGDTRSFY